VKGTGNQKLPLKKIIRGDGNREDGGGIIRVHSEEGKM